MMLFIGLICLSYFSYGVIYFSAPTRIRAMLKSVFPFLFTGEGKQEKFCMILPDVDLDNTLIWETNMSALNIDALQKNASNITERERKIIELNLIRSPVPNDAMCVGLDYIPKAVVVRWIHLKKRTDRKVHMKQNILPIFDRLVKCLDWVVEEVSACCFTLKEYIKENITAIDNLPPNDTEGRMLADRILADRILAEIRILRSHANAVRISSNRSNHVLILEDDVGIELIDKHFFRSLAYAFSISKTTNWGILRMGYHPFNTSLTTKNIRLIRGCGNHTYGAFAYVVNGAYRPMYFEKLQTAWIGYLRGGWFSRHQADNLMVEKSIFVNTSDIPFESKYGIPITFLLEPRAFGHLEGWSDNWGMSRPPVRRRLSRKSRLWKKERKKLQNSFCTC